MTDLRLTIKKRAFPSHGRVRLHESCLTELKITQGDSVDLVNEGARKTVTVTVIADRMVGENEVRVSEEDLKDLGLNDGAEVVVRRTPPLKEKVDKVVRDANTSLSKGAAKLDTDLKKTGESVKAGAAKTAESVKAGTKKAADKVGKAAEKTTAAVKKSLKKDDL